MSRQKYPQGEELQTSSSNLAKPTSHGYDSVLQRNRSYVRNFEAQLYSKKLKDEAVEEAIGLVKILDCRIGKHY
jgi:hypothetical protein